MTNKKLSVLLVTPSYYPFVGGAETYVQAMAERLAQNGHDVSVITTTATQVDCFWNPRSPQAQPGPDCYNGVAIHRCALGHLPLSPWSFYLMRRLSPMVSGLPWGALAALNQMSPWMPRVPHIEAAIQAFAPKPNIIHGVNIALEWPLIAAGRYARRLDIPFVTTPFVHIGAWEVQRNYTMRHQLDALSQSHAIVVQTALEREVLVGMGLQPNRIISVGMGVDPDKLQTGDAQRFCLQQNIQGPVITFMGALTFDKGVLHVCEAMRQLWQQGVSATLVLAGKPVLAGGFDSYYEALPQADRANIRLLGQVGGQLKQDMLAATTVFVMPSRIDSFGIVYLEAWACGKPVIGARAGGVPAVIDEGQTGLLVEFGNVKEIAAAIHRLLDNPSLAQAMGEQGRQRVHQHRTWDSVYRKTHAIYQIVTGQIEGPLEQVECIS